MWHQLSEPVGAEQDPCFPDAPWSEKCKALLPLLEELGIKYQNHSTVVIAKIDITANDIELANPDQYPFFRLFPTDSQEVRGSWDHIIENVMSPPGTQCLSSSALYCIFSAPVPSMLPCSSLFSSFFHSSSKTLQLHTT